MHIRLDKELEAELEVYAKARGSNKSATIRTALRKLFKDSPLDPEVEFATKQALERYFSVPSNFTSSSFFTTLYVIGNAYPEHKVRKAWGPLYHSTLDLTNKDLLDTLKNEIKRATTPKAEEAPQD